MRTIWDLLLVFLCQLTGASRKMRQGERHPEERPMFAAGSRKAKRTRPR